ncbi:hypothetical protein NADFUDRAFT_39937 [Nadsonia fulvescens var. elongata DSM 6958]|uniref:Uncharacterized protein n=1 Tax=Nadsonia fulvescens var. elongata DSM 6958 TaxID=857566 RepID=A0A1E3PTH3_9ASCO|nr:hypothetical protein NADFUDRAFT_39937 [Nadsonia fulvescens var. elongata DSM 6958]
MDSVESNLLSLDVTAPLDKNVDNNPDIIALKSTLSLLEAQRQVAMEDIKQLNRLKQHALESPAEFTKELMEHGSIEGAPRMQHIVRAPTIDWQNDYGASGDYNNRPYTNSDQATFRRVRLFGSPSESGPK